MRISSPTPAILMMSALLLGACEHMPWKEKEYKSAPTAVSVTNSSVDMAQTPGGYGSSLAGVSPYGTTDYKAMTSMASGGSVELYNLDTGQSYGGRGETLAVAPLPGRNVDGGVPMIGNPNVMVYPLGDSYDTYGHMGEQSQQMGMYNPANVGGGGAIQRGALAPWASGPATSIYFDYGSSVITGQGKTVLRSAAETAKFAPVDRVAVEGHASVPTQSTDPVEARILNLRQSLKRAEAVSKSLIQQGVPAEKIKTVGWGDTKLSAGTEAEQRRVDIITGPGAAPLGY